MHHPAGKRCHRRKLGSLPFGTSLLYTPLALQFINSMPWQLASRASGPFCSSKDAAASITPAINSQSYCRHQADMQRQAGVSIPIFPCTPSQPAVSENIPDACGEHKDNKNFKMYPKLALAEYLHYTVHNLFTNKNKNQTKH